MMKRREFIVGSAMLGADFAMHATTKSLRVEIWHGRHHRIGHLGDVQDDFNVLGHIYSVNPISSVPAWSTTAPRERCGLLSPRGLSSTEISTPTFPWLLSAPETTTSSSRRPIPKAVSPMRIQSSRGNWQEPTTFRPGFPGARSIL